jgi:hypothetical protein
MFRVKSTRRSNGKKDSATATVVSEPVVNTLTSGSIPSVSVPSTPFSSPVEETREVPAAAAGAAAAAAAAPAKGSSFLEFIAAESNATALAKPWLRLDRGLRLQRFRAYADAYPGLSVAEKAKLYEVLLAANDKKLLNTKQQVNYENGVIQSVRGLKVIRTGDTKEPAVIKIEPSRLTKRNTEDV